MLLRIKYNAIKEIIITTKPQILNFLTLNKFLKGVKITRIKPTKLLIKNLG